MNGARAAALDGGDHRGPRLPADVAVIGAGVLGTSIALALRERDVRVVLDDSRPARLRLACDLGAGEPVRAGEHVELAVLAVPPGAVAGVLFDTQQRRLADIYTDVASVKVAPLARAQALGCDLASYVPGHPMAGSERSGPAAARADLFLGRPWALCPTTKTSAEALAAARALAEACGAEPTVVDVDEHDRAVALISHAPQLAASAVAARLNSASGTELGLVGQGMRDVTRIAASDTDLWSVILANNAGPVAGVLREIARDLDGVARALASLAERSGAEVAASEELEAIADLLRRGRDGRGRLPGKHGGPAPSFAVVPVVIGDEPGELARLFAAAGEAGVNIEDITLEHSPGLPVGVAELAVRPDAVGALVKALDVHGWKVHGA